MDENIKRINKAKEIIRKTVKLDYMKQRGHNGLNLLVYPETNDFNYEFGIPANGVFIPNYIISGGKQSCYNFLNEQIEYLK